MNTNNPSRVLDSVARDAVPDDVNLMPKIAAGLGRVQKKQRHGRPGAFILMLLLAAAFITLLVAVPEAAEAMKRLLGYIPGVGVVEQSMPIRVLAEPVSVTREGVTVEVKQATLTADRTVIVYSVYGVPASAYPRREDVAGCYSPEYLRLPDGTKLGLDDAGFSGRGIPPVPIDVNEATFILPCISSTLPGTVPEDWELHLRFVPAPPDMTVMPVMEITPSSETNELQTPSASQSVVVNKVVDTGDGYILVGSFHPETTQDRWVQITEAARITDAQGREVFYTTPNDVDALFEDDPGGSGWAYEIKGANIAYPLMITFSGVYISPADPQAEVEFEFNAGPNPQLGQEWILNKDIQISGHTLRLVSISSGSHGGSPGNPSGGYSFNFTCDPDVNGVRMDIEGHTPNGGGGGGGAGLGEFGVDLSYPDLPTGILKVILSDLTVITGPGTWQAEWQPESSPSEPSPAYGITLAVDKSLAADGGYYLIGHTAWTDERISGAVFPSGAMKAFDASGREIPMEPADFSDVRVENPGPAQWVYRVKGDSFDGFLTLRAAKIDVQFVKPVTLTIDLRPYGIRSPDEMVEGTWGKTGIIPLDVPDYLVDAFNVKFIRQGGLQGLEIGMEADPAILELKFDIESGVTGGTGAGAGTSGREEETGLLLSSILTDGRMTFPIRLNAPRAVLSGRWETSWTPSREEPHGSVHPSPPLPIMACPEQREGGGWPDPR
jgi:hypothetical protein